MNLYTTMKEALATHAVVLAYFYHHYLDGANIYGVGSRKAPWMQSSHGAGTMHPYRALKKTLDPTGILNPGKMGL